MKAGTYKGKFEELNDALQKSMQQLNLGLAAQQLRNHEQDKEDQEADYQFIISKQDEIIRACLLMEYMEKGSLYELLAKEKLTPEQ